MNVRKFIPKTVKLRLKQLNRSLKDLLSGVRFARNQKNLQTYNYSITLSQPIKVAHLYENKIENLKLAGRKINEIVIAPGEVFSFWHVLGNPSEKNGYKKGRNIVSGVMSEEFGGGLCQLSGILYHLSLMSGLEVVERYNHSVDFYTEENRYTPIGCDATVVYGYKDLRIKNNFVFPVRFTIETTIDHLIARLYSSSPINQTVLLFERKEYGNTIEVTGVNESGRIVSHSKYRKKDE